MNVGSVNGHQSPACDINQNLFAPAAPMNADLPRADIPRALDCSDSDLPFDVEAHDALTDIDEFFGRLQIVKDPFAEDLVLVPRIDAWIGGLGMDEAILRGHPFGDAGADAILFSSAKRAPRTRQLARTHRSVTARLVRLRR